MDILTLEKKLAELQASLERLLSLTIQNNDFGNEELAEKLRNCLNTVTNLQSGAVTSQSDIIELQQAVEELQSQSGGSEHIMLLADSITVSTDVRSDDTILQKIAKAGARIDNIQAQINTRILPSDPYNTAGMTFYDYPAGTILRTYDFFEKEINISTGNNLTFPEAFFCAEEGSEVDIKIEFDYVGSLNIFDMLVKVHLNNIVVYQEVVSVTELNTQKKYSTLVPGVILNTPTRAATVKVTLAISGGGKNVATSRFKAELIGPNAEMIFRPNPYNVQYIQGKYYVSDCSTGIAKTAEIVASQMWNMDSLVWNTTDLEVIKYMTGFTSKPYSTDYFLEDKVIITLNRNNQLMIYSTKNDATKTVENIFQMSWQPRRELKTYITYPNPTTKNAAYSNINETFSSHSIGEYSGNPKALFVTAFDLLFNVTEYVTSNHPSIIITYAGEIIVVQSISSSSPKISLGYGSFARAYMTANSTALGGWFFDVYIKHYDKIIKKSIKFLSNKFTILSTEVIGSYEDYFRGANNDYFVVKNGQLQYFKDPVPE